MEYWEDQAIILSVRKHGENGAVVSAMTQNHGRHAGYVNGATSKKMRGILEVGNLVDLNWQARQEDNLGTFKAELVQNIVARYLDSPLKLSAIQSACSLCDAAMPEREIHENIFHGLGALFETMGSSAWGAAYIFWEISLLRELGFSLDLSRCAGGGDIQNLAYVSPKTGCAVSYQAGEPYKDKLLPLPAFLKHNKGPADNEEIHKGLVMTGYFFEHWAFVHHKFGMPEARRYFQDRYKQSLKINAEESI